MIRLNNIRKALLPLLFAISMLFAFSTVAFSESGELTQCVTVKQSVTGVPSKTTYKYYLMPMKDGNPMPEGTGEDGLYTFSLSGNDSTKFYLPFIGPGTYEYELRRTEAVPEGDTVIPTIHPFGYVVKEAADGSMEVIPYTCYDAYMEIVDKDGKPLEIVLTNNISKEEPSSRTTTSTTKRTTTRTTTKTGTSARTTTRTNVVTRTVGRVVNTGDPYQIGLWIGLVILSAGALIAIIAFRRKKENESDNENR